MLSAPLENAFHNGSWGFAVSSQLPGCLLLFWVAYFLARLMPWITLSGFVLQSPIPYWRHCSVCGWSSCHFDSAQEVAHYRASGLVDEEVVTHKTECACVQAGHKLLKTIRGSHLRCFHTGVYNDMIVALIRVHMYQQWWREYWKSLLKYKYCYVAKILLNYK